MSEDDFGTRKQASILLPYYKQGDDIQRCIDESKNLDEALERHAEYMDSGAEQLRAIKDAIRGYADAKVSAGSHCIFIEGKPEMIDALVHSELAFADEAEAE